MDMTRHQKCRELRDKNALKNELGENRYHGRPKKRLLDRIRKDMEARRLYFEDTLNRKK